jgi:hypothetical protein
VISQSATAPETSLIEVNVAASICVFLSATRQSSEFPANATIASNVKSAARVLIIDFRPVAAAGIAGRVADHVSQPSPYGRRSHGLR